MKQNLSPSSSRSSQHFTKKRSVKAGLPPGSLVHIGDRPERSAGISIMRYDSESFREMSCATLGQCFDGRPAGGVAWVNIEGVHDTGIVSELGARLALHPLVLEDIVNTAQRPKVEEYGDYLFIVLRMLRTTDDNGFCSEQLSIIVGPDYLVTFQEGLYGDVFETVRNRIRGSKGKIRGMGTDYLAYTLIDAIVDSYFSVIEAMGERIVDVEEQLALVPEQATLHHINAMKKEIIYLRKSVWPVREVVSFLERGDTPLVGEATRVYFRDIYDHTIQVIDTVETYRDLLSGMLDLYLSSISNRTNEVMKFLTVIGTIFMPLTFLAGVYGMNFKHMPELEWRYGYFALWVVMLLGSLVMVIYFRRKRWL